MRVTIREADTLARLGGDEFALLLEHSGTDGQMTTARLVSRPPNGTPTPTPPARPPTPNPLCRDTGSVMWTGNRGTYGTGVPC